MKLAVMIQLSMVFLDDNTEIYCYLAPLHNGTYNSIHSNLVFPSVASHSPQALSQYLKALKPGGSVYLVEPVLITDLSNTSCPITRKESDIVSMLKLAGFVDVAVESSTSVSDEALNDFFKAWGVTKRVDQAVSRLSGKFATVQIVAKKPTYEVGKKFALNFKKNPAKVEEQKKVWTIAVSEEDAELEDEDLLLDEEDKIKPSKEALIRKLFIMWLLILHERLILSFKAQTIAK